MKRLLLLASALFWSCTIWAQLIITGVIDGPLSGGTPKAIELYALEDIPNLGIYGLGAANNGTGSDGVEFSLPQTSVARGSFLYVASEFDQFEVFFGFPPHFFGGAASFINGDDAIELFKYNTVIDVFGEINVDGTGQPWEYLDGWAYRQDGTGPDGSVFQLGNFYYSGANALDNQSSNATATVPFPIGSYSTIMVDGTLDASGVYGAPFCLQNNETGFGDNNDPAADVANGSELDAPYAVIDGGKLFLFLAGNLESNFNKLDIFIDTHPGGQNQLPGNNPDVDFNGLNRMGDDGSGNGMTFDDVFFANYYFTATGGNQPYELYASMAPTDGSGGVGTFLGGGTGSVQALSNGGTIAVNNANIAGVTATTIGNPGAVTTGIEWSIPLSSIGNPSGVIRIMAFVNGSSHDFLSNQVLCGIGGGLPNLGEPRVLDFGNIGGDQFFSLCSGVDGGFVIDGEAQGTVYTCPGDGLADVVSFDSITTSNVNYTYLITDENGIILTFPSVDQLDFENSGFGEARIYGLAYTGNLTAMIGNDLAQVVLSDSCFDLSDNYIRVVRDTAGGGMVMTELGQDTASICIGSGQLGQIASFDSTGNSRANYTYLITDDQNVFLGLSSSGHIDFASLSSTASRVWGLSFTGSVTAQTGDTITAVNLSDACFDLSANYVTVLRDSIGAGTVSAVSDTVRYCVASQGGMDGAFQMDSLNVIGGTTYIYLITDTLGNILALPGGDMIDLSNAGPGECWVWGLNYAGNLLAQPGDNALTTLLATDCYDLSDNYIVALRDSVAGGTVFLETGMDTAYYCPYNAGGNDQGVFVMDKLNAFGPTYDYVITDTAGVILAVSQDDTVDVSLAGLGQLWIWGLAYNGSLTALPGDTASTTMLSDQCWSLSENYVVIYVDSVSGGTILTLDQQDSVRVCISDGEPDAITFEGMDILGSQYALVVTDTNTRILDFPALNIVDFTSSSAGVAWVWGLSYEGELLAQVGDTAASTTIATGCYDPSSNFVVVMLDTVGGACTVGIESELGFQSVQLYPNPASGSLTFAFRSAVINEASSEIRLYSATGQLVRQAHYPTLPSGKNTFSVPLDGLSDGLYLLEFRNGERRISRSVVVVD